MGLRIVAKRPRPRFWRPTAVAYLVQIKHFLGPGTTAAKTPSISTNQQDLSNIYVMPSMMKSFLGPPFVVSIYVLTAISDIMKAGIIHYVLRRFPTFFRCHVTRF